MNANSRGADVPFAHDYSWSWVIKMIDAGKLEKNPHEMAIMDSLRCKTCNRLFGCAHASLDELPPWKQRRVERIKASL